MRLVFMRLDKELPRPSTAVKGDAGMDLYARHACKLQPAGGRAGVGTGIAVAIPDGHVGLVTARSGLALDAGITVLNAPGVIDSGFRGEVVVILINTGQEPYSVHRSDRIAQLIVVSMAPPDWDEAITLSPSDRGLRGLGHSGR